MTTYFSIRFDNIESGDPFGFGEFQSVMPFEPTADIEYRFGDDLTFSPLSVVFDFRNINFYVELETVGTTEGEFKKSISEMKKIGWKFHDVKKRSL